MDSEHARQGLSRGQVLIGCIRAAGRLFTRRQPVREFVGRANRAWPHQTAAPVPAHSGVAPAVRTGSHPVGTVTIHRTGPANAAGGKQRRAILGIAVASGRKVIADLDPSRAPDRASGSGIRNARVPFDSMT